VGGSLNTYKYILASSALLSLPRQEIPYWFFGGKIINEFLKKMEEQKDESLLKIKENFSLFCEESDEQSSRLCSRLKSKNPIYGPLSAL